MKGQDQLSLKSMVDHGPDDSGCFRTGRNWERQLARALLHRLAYADQTFDSCLRSNTSKTATTDVRRPSR